MRPKSLLDPSFRYYNAADTDLRRTFARVKRELAKAAEEQKPPPPVVTPIKRAAK